MSLFFPQIPVKKDNLHLFLFLFHNCLHLLSGFPRLARLARLPGLPGLSSLAAAPASATSTTLTAALAPLLALLAALSRLAFAILLATGEVGRRQPLRQVNLGADGVGEVGDHEDVLDVVVKVVLNLCGVHLGRERQGVHQVLAEGVVGLLLLIEDAVNPLADALDEVGALLNGAGQALNVRNDGGDAVLGVLGHGDGLEGATLGVTVHQLVGHLDEEAALGGALGIDGDRGGNVAAGLDVGGRVGADGQVDGGVGEGAGVRGGEEVLDQGGEGVELVRSSVPTQKGFARGGLEGEGEHVLLVVDVHLDLVLVLGVRDGEAGANLNLGAIFGAGADEGADNAGRLGIADVSSNGMVEDGEDGLQGEAGSACGDWMRGSGHLEECMYMREKKSRDYMWCGLGARRGSAAQISEAFVPGVEC